MYFAIKKSSQGAALYRSVDVVFFFAHHVSFHHVASQLARATCHSRGVVNSCVVLASALRALACFV